MVTAQTEMKEFGEEIVNLVIDLRNLGNYGTNQASARGIVANIIKNPGSSKKCLENGIEIVEYIDEHGQANKRELSGISEHSPSQSNSLSPAKCGVITLVDSENKKFSHVYNYKLYKLASPDLGERYRGTARKLIEKIDLLMGSKSVCGKTEGVYSEN